MAESYDIHLTDPLSSAFKVRAFTSNGTVFPTTTRLSDTAVGAESSLLVYGKGHANYGERIAENILHLLENFSGSTAPENPISGQLWYQRFTIVTDTTGTTWWLYTDATGWGTITVTAGGLPPDPATETDGTYFLDGVDHTTDLLYLTVNDTSHPLSPTFLQRDFEEVDTDPTVSGIEPRKVLRVYTGEQWESVSSAVRASDEEPTGDLIDGDMWFDTNDNSLYVHVGGFWLPVSDNFLPIDGSTPMAGNIDMGNNYIVNLRTPSALGSPAYSNHAATVEFVNDAVASAGIPTSVGSLSNVSVAADSGTSRQALVVTGAGANLWSASTLVTTDLSGVTVSSAELNYLTGATSNIQNQLDLKIEVTGGSPYAMQGPFFMNGNELVNARVTPAPSFDWDIANKAYVDAAAGGGGADTYVASVQHFTVLTAGSPPRAPGDLVFQYNDLTPELVVAGIENTGHTHESTDVNYTPTENTLLSDFSIPPTNVQEGLDYLDNFLVRRTSNRRFVQTAPAGSPATLVTFDVPGYTANFFNLFVFVNGVKYIASSSGSQVVTFFVPPTNVSLTGLDTGSPITNYTATIYVDAVGSPASGNVENISVAGNNATTFKDLVEQLNAQMTSAVAALEDGELVIYSNTYGSGSNVSISDVDLFSSLTSINAIEPATPGVDYGYSENAGHGAVGNQISFTTPLTGGEIIETIVFGDGDQGII